MSINDILEADLTAPLTVIFIIFIIVVAIAVPMGLKLSKKTNNEIFGEDGYGVVVVEKNAKVLAKRVSPHPLNHSVMVNWVVFELEHGDRVELAIQDTSKYGIMVVGDCGTLKYQGKKFIYFARNDGVEA